MDVKRGSVVLFFFRDMSAYKIDYMSTLSLLSILT